MFMPIVNYHRADQIDPTDRESVFETGILHADLNNPGLAIGMRKRIGDFELKATIGEGTFGLVKEGVHTPTG